MPHAVAGAVIIVQAREPKMIAGQGIEVVARPAFGPSGAGHGDQPLEHQGEAGAGLRRRSPDRHCAGDVRCSVKILAAGVDQQQVTLGDAPVAGGRDRVVNQRAVRAGRGDGSEAAAPEKAGPFPESVDRLGDIHLGQPVRGARLQPGQELRERGTVAPVRLLGIGDFGPVFRGLCENARVRALDDRAPQLLQTVEHMNRGGGRIDKDGVPGTGKATDEVRLWQDVQFGLDFHLETAGQFEEQVHIPVRVQNCEGKGNR